MLSPATRKRDLTVKADRYLKNGVAEYWIVDPDEKEVQLWVNRQNQWEKHTGDELTSSLIPDCKISAGLLFK